MRINTRIAALLATAVFDVAVVGAVAPDWMLAADALLLLLMVKAVVFVVLYGTRSKWRQTSAGRAVMGLIACIATICGIGVLNLLLGDYPGRPFVRLAAFAAVGITMMNLLLALIAAQRGGRG